MNHLFVEVVELGSVLMQKVFAGPDSSFDGVQASNGALDRYRALLRHGDAFRGAGELVSA